jgi:mannose-6-phosphate isomerase-like protein (cupin superfamily)
MDAEQPWFGRLADAKGTFFRVLHTTPRTQVATMTVAPGEAAGPPEVHEGEDQIFLIVEGEAEVKVWHRGAKEEPRHDRLLPGAMLVVPAGMRHWVKSVGREPLFFFTAYGPPAY